MLYFLNLWLFLLPCCWLLGSYLSLRLGLDEDAAQRDQTLIALWLGLVSWAVVFLALSLHGALSLTLGLGVMSGVSLLCLLDGRLRSRARLLWQNGRRTPMVTAALLMVGLSAWMSQPVTWHDAGYYHYSAIQWFRDYGSVPGIALLFHNLGFTSSWFALAAPFNPAFAAARVAAGLNGFALFLAGIHWVLCAGPCFSQAEQGRLSDRLATAFYTLAIPICLGMKPLSLILISPSPDLPVFLLVGVVAWAMAREGQEKTLLPVALALGAVSLKLTALPLLASTGLYYLFGAGRFGAGRLGLPRLGRLVKLGLIATLFLIPQIASSIVTSGCPLYPSAKLCLDLPWSPTVQSAQDVAIGTHGWTKWYGEAPAGVPSWLWAMGRWVSSDRSEQITALLIVGAIVWVGFSLWRQRQARRLPTLVQTGDQAFTQTSAQSSAQTSLPGEIWIAGLGLLGIGFLMATTPFFRFSVAYIVLLLALGACNFKVPQVRWRWNFGVIAGTIALVVLNLQRYHFSNVVFAPPMRNTQIIQRQIHGITYSAPKSGDIPNTQDKDMCWSAELPCAYEIPGDVYLREPERGIAGGFRRDRF
jgi:hypothetical protein